MMEIKKPGDEIRFSYATGLRQKRELTKAHAAETLEDGQNGDQKYGAVALHAKYEKRQR